MVTLVALLLLRNAGPKKNEFLKIDLLNDNFLPSISH